MGFIGKLIEAIIGFFVEMVFKKAGDKKERKKSLKQFWKDHREEEKRKADEIIALPFNEKVKRSLMFIWNIIWAGTLVIIIFSTLIWISPEVFKWTILVFDGSWISELLSPGSAWE